jgi:pimeloyl-ACP methyl ester carboxylesterase
LPSPWHITLVGHSNGAAVILDALTQFPCPRIDSLHLVCAACESSFAKNRLNLLLSYPENASTLQRLNVATCGIGQVSVYVAKRDLALRLAHSWAGRLLGYGVLGLHGPRHILPSVAARVRVIDWPSFGHSDCWNEDNLNDTLENFIPKQTHFAA